ncbi:ATP-binding protein [Cytobacillus sp. NCCP-133]|uniref:ATP-binding protein n=1 Tax=Cytobacillus sp. NCCP-133 TaxID=766848 RepID=UPI0022306068|nr:ATP-binding protein [Cytobacillus sp. NCCP-133]GLB60957.1 hypothetical protein NCCP133_30890 [Cytobacillus sp. NCCP-133]
MRDVITFSVSSGDTLVIAADNSGAIGEKDQDAVHVPYETVAYFTFRVSVMECLSAGGEPFAVIMQNFCGDEAWSSLVKGIEQGMNELGLTNLVISGSTESNFQLSQSAVGLSVLGKKVENGDQGQIPFTNESSIAVIGSPLVGEEVIQHGLDIVPLDLFQEINSLSEVVTLPVGSKGILYKLNELFSNKAFSGDEFNAEVDIHKSSGPSTCFIAVFPQEKTEEIRKRSGKYFHLLK